MEDKKAERQQYWEQNIKGYSGFYDKGSEERIYGPAFLTLLYRKCIFPIEQRVTRQRFDATMDFIQRNVKAGSIIADIGCGGGIFTKYMVSLGAKVYAIDYTQSALDLTAKKLSMEEARRVEFLKKDVIAEDIPKVDAAIAIGVLPYIDDLDKFFKHVLPFTSSFFFNFLNKNAMLNVLRQKVSSLDVRGYSYHDVETVRKILMAEGFNIIGMKKIGIGFLVEARRSGA